MKMKALIIPMFLIAHGAIAADHHDHSKHQDSTQLKLDNGKKWPTDAALRDGMTQIKKLMAAQVPAIHKNTLSKEKYVSLADDVSQATANIFKNCKLNPDADAVLHIILAQILDGMKAMKSADKIDDQRGGAVKIITALEQYPQYFSHEGWAPLKH